MPAGLRAAQLCHAALEYARGAPIAAGETLVLLEVADEPALKALHDRAVHDGYVCAAFFEPDIGNELTALALEAHAKPLVRGLPLALCADAGIARRK